MEHYNIKELLDDLYYHLKIYVLVLLVKTYMYGYVYS